MQGLVNEHQGPKMRSKQSRCKHAERFYMFCTHLAGQLLIVLHHLLILLVDSQHFADTICSCLSLSGNRVMSSARSNWLKHCVIKSTRCAQSLVTVFAAVAYLKTGCCTCKSLKQTSDYCLLLSNVAIISTLTWSFITSFIIIKRFCTPNMCEHTPHTGRK